MSAAGNALPAIDNALSGGTDELPNFCHLLSFDHHAMPQRRDDVPAADYGLPQCEHRLSKPADLLPGNINGLSKCRYSMSGGVDTVPRGDHAVSATGDGVCAACAGTDVHHHRLGF